MEKAAVFLTLHFHILVGNESVCHLYMLSGIELYLNSSMHANHPKFDSYLKSNKTGFDEVTLFTLCLTKNGILLWEHSKNQNLAIQAGAGATCKENKWSGVFQLYALANVLGRAVYSVYQNLKSCSQIKDFSILSHGVPLSSVYYDRSATNEFLTKLKCSRLSCQKTLLELNFIAYYLMEQLTNKLHCKWQFLFCTSILILLNLN